ncbi:MAG: phosphotransferase [Bacilli bacterium]|nr:phosphotransferase [Bacilli bacterium]
MEKIIDLIVSNNENIFGKNPKIKKINVGFTNTIYEINDSFIVKICSNVNNEENFKKEIDFYNKNKDNTLIPKLYYSNIDKKIIPYYYEIIEKIKGVSLYNVWHKYNESEREHIIKQLCAFMKQMHSIKGNNYNWSEYFKNSFITIYDRIKELNIFNNNEESMLKEAYTNFDKYLDSSEFVLIHNDLHFDNIFVDNGTIKIIDFERSMYAPKDFELDIIYRMIRKPWKFASEENEKYTKLSDYENIISYISKYYPEIIDTPNLYKRLAIYDIVYFMRQLEEYPHLEELKLDVLKSVKLVIQK